MSGTWQVASILKEPLFVTLRFVAWYLEQGADHVTLFFDDPQDPAIGVLDTHPDVTCIPCTAEFWGKIGLSPDIRFTKRQNAAITWAYHRLQEGWLLNVDSDEFLVLKSGSVSDLLARQEATTQAVRIRTAELVRPETPQPDLQFRTPMARDVARRVYQDNAKLFGPRRQGLMGHPQGKSLTRAGLRRARLRQHWAEIPRQGRAREVELSAKDGAYLLHMIGEDYYSWRRKVDWRMASAGFTHALTDQIADVLTQEDPEPDLFEIYLGLHELSDDALARLHQEGVGVSLAVDLDRPAQRLFGEAYDVARKIA
ncbi:MAG: glycosyltransferase family 2 protein [Rhodobacteraceae bacterium]|nr:glycosyltransferase family 2 protein [Paracoccaceae bacterium]